MTLAEFSFLVMALASATIAIVAVVIAVRLLPVLRQSDLFLRRSRRTLRRVNRVTRELELIARDARMIESRVARSAHGLLDQVEPMLGVLRGVMAGARSGLGTLFSPNGEKAAERRDPLSTRKGTEHER
jgi:hypothetical protein